MPGTSRATVRDEPQEIGRQLAAQEVLPDPPEKLDAHVVDGRSIAERLSPIEQFVFDFGE
ncbi:MAG: hypothetical protein E6I45_06045 [Chloroflexi bacterium]|nr:MAG: hypothetical protein E6I45_06045 [Chloroflexota bacterium]